MRILYLALAVVNCVGDALTDTPFKVKAAEDEKHFVTTLMAERKRTLKNNDIVKIQDNSYYLSMKKFGVDGTERKNVALPITLISVNNRLAIPAEPYIFERVFDSETRISERYEARDLMFTNPFEYLHSLGKATELAKCQDKSKLKEYKAGMRLVHEWWACLHNRPDKDHVCITTFFLDNKESRIAFTESSEVEYYLLKPIEMHYLRSRIVNKPKEYKNSARKDYLFYNLEMQRDLVRESFLRLFINRKHILKKKQ